MVAYKMIKTPYAAMNVFTTGQHLSQSLSRHIIHPIVKSLSEYINTLYYTNQLVAYALCIVTMTAKRSVAPMVIAITVPSLAAALFLFFMYIKKNPPQKGTLLDNAYQKLFKLQLMTYSNLLCIILIASLSSICLVFSFETLLIYYTSIMGKQVQITPLSTAIVTTAVIALKLWELVANIPLIERIKEELNPTEEKSNKTINKTQEQYKIILHCCNYFVGFTTNSLSVIIALASAGAASISLISAISILASITTLSIITCILIYQKHQNQIENIYSTSQTTSTPNTLPQRI